MMVRKITVIAGFISVFAGSFSWGIGEFTPVQERALGHSVTGASLLNDSLYTNPASSVFTQVYSVEGTYLPPRTFGVSILDTRTSNIGGGVAYFRKEVGDFADPLQGFKVMLGSRVSNSLGAGIGGKFMWGPDLRGDRTNMNDVDLGLFGQMGLLHYGASLHNLFGGNQRYEQQREASVGARINWEDTLFFGVSTAAPTASMKPYQVGVGMEYVSPYYFSLKGGYRFQMEQSASYWSAGASLLAPKISMHYAAEFPNAPGQSIEHSVSVGILF